MLVPEKCSIPEKQKGTVFVLSKEIIIFAVNLTLKTVSAMMIIEAIGQNAGTVWQLLNAQSDAVSVTFIKQSTGLKDSEVYAAIGWLAREGKIFFAEKDGKTVLSLTPINIYF